MMITLASGHVQVEVTPEKGSDIMSVVDLASGVQVLFRTPWADARPEASAWDTKSRWLAAYRGGWQVLCPNAGDERVSEAAVRGYHGEAAIVPWEVVARDERSVTTQVSLFTAPFTLRRTVTVDGPVVRVHEAVCNASPDPHELVWMHHPAYGAPLVGAEARYDLPGATVVTDAQAPGTLLPPGVFHEWPMTATVDGVPLDLRELAGPEAPREIFAALTDLVDGWYALRNPYIGLGVAFRWDPKVFPHAWFWQEMHATAGFPWFRRAYAAAIEPSNVLPGADGHVNGVPRGQGPMLPGGVEVDTTLEMTLFRPDGQVRGVGWGGVIT